MKNCKNCNTELKGSDQKLFCSQSCSASFNNKGITRNPKNPNKTCSCGNKKTKISISCNSCKLQRISDITLDKPISALYEFSGGSSTKYNRIRIHARRLMKLHRIQKHCAKCNHNEFDSIVEVCHLRQLNTFPDNTLLREANSLLNLAYLCPSHHTLLDKSTD